MDENYITKLNPDIVAGLLIEMIVDIAYRGSIRDHIELLQAGANWPKPRKELVRLHDWYLQLDKNGQNRVKELVSEVAEMAIFHVLAIIDGTSGSLITDTRTELSLQLLTYIDKESQAGHQPKRIINVYPREVTTGFLHDLFQEAIHTSKVDK